MVARSPASRDSRICQAAAKTTTQATQSTAALDNENNHGCRSLHLLKRLPPRGVGSEPQRLVVQLAPQIVAQLLRRLVTIVAVIRQALFAGSL